MSLVALVGVAALGACAPAPTEVGGGGSGGSNTRSGGASGSGGRSGSGGSGSGGSSSGGSTGSGSGGSASGSGGGGGSTSGGSGGAASGSGGAGGASSGSGGAAGDASVPETAGDTPSTGGGWKGFPGIEDLSTAKPTPGCGSDPGQALGDWVRAMITITPKPVKGMGNRSYFVKLPANYDKAKPYRLIFVVPGCNGQGNNMYDFTTAAGTEGVIQVGLNPDPMAFSFAGCFDDFNTKSVELQFMETLLDVLGKKLCFDQHRVFSTGHSSGSFVSNMFGCVYGGTKIRAIAPSSGGLADNSMGANMAAPCLPDKPTAGIWSHNEDDNGNLPIWTQKAITRALVANKCTGDFASSPRAMWMNEPNCQTFTSCPPEFPIVYCHPKTGGHTGNLDVQPARSWKFFKSLP